MGVDVEGAAYLAVAQPLLAHLRMRAQLQEQSSRRVAKVVEANLPKARRLQEGPEGALAVALSASRENGSPSSPAMAAGRQGDTYENQAAKRHPMAPGAGTVASSRRSRGSFPAEHRLDFARQAGESRGSLVGK